MKIYFEANHTKSYIAKTGSSGPLFYIPKTRSKLNNLKELVFLIDLIKR